jgi:hypothetical protein
MPNEIETISYIDLGDGKAHPIDAVSVGGVEASNLQEKNLVTTISASSTDSQYPSAKCMWDIIGNIETRLSNI